MMVVQRRWNALHLGPTASPMSHQHSTTRPRFLDRIEAPCLQAVATEGCFVYCYLRAEVGTPYYIGIASTWWRPTRPHNSAAVPQDRARIRVLRSGLDWESACMWECRYIARYGRKDIGTGILRNRTDGGEGTCNPSPEHRARLSHAAKNITPETRAKRSLSAKRRGITQETRAKISAALVGRRFGPQPQKGTAISEGKMVRGAAQLGVSMDDYKVMTWAQRRRLRKKSGLPALRSDASMRTREQRSVISKGLHTDLQFKLRHSAGIKAAAAAKRVTVAQSLGISAEAFEAMTPDQRYKAVKRAKA